jgi:hypothetical protein
MLVVLRLFCLFSFISFVRVTHDCWVKGVFLHFNNISSILGLAVSGNRHNTNMSYISKSHARWKCIKCTYSRSIVNGNRFMAVASIDGIGWCNPNCYHITAAMMFTFSAIGQWTWIANLWFSFFPLRPSNILSCTCMLFELSPYSTHFK